MQRVELSDGHFAAKVSVQNSVFIEINSKLPVLQTVVQTAEKCKDLQIPFPEVVLPAENTEPQDFYLFKGSSDAPTVIHIPLFNAVNCKGKIGRAHV